MVSKCANPDCAASFRYFHVGKLFRLDTSGRPDRRRTMGEDVSSKKPLRRTEFYWLCENCSSTMTLTFNHDAGVGVRRNISAKSAAA
jgi:hypothetical protein